MVEKYILELEKKVQALQSNIENKEREIKSLQVELANQQRDFDKLYSNTEKLNDEKERLEADWEQKKKNLSKRIRQLEREFTSEKSINSQYISQISSCCSLKEKLENDLRKLNFINSNLEAEKEILEKQVVEAEKVIQDLEKTNAFYVEKDTLFVGELENYKFFLQEVEAKIRNYHHRLKNKKTDQIATTISLADELRKVERRPSFSPRNSYLFDSPPPSPSSSSSPTRATSFSPSTYYNTRRKLSEVSEIDFSTEGLREVEEKVLRLIIGLIENETYFGGLSVIELTKQLQTEKNLNENFRARIRCLEKVCGFQEQQQQEEEILETSIRMRRTSSNSSVSKSLPKTISNSAKISESYQEISECFWEELTKVFEKEKEEIIKEAKEEIEISKKIYLKERDKRKELEKTNKSNEQKIKELEEHILKANITKKVILISSSIAIIVTLSLIVFFLLRKITKKKSNKWGKTKN